MAGWFGRVAAALNERFSRTPDLTPISEHVVAEVRKVLDEHGYETTTKDPVLRRLAEALKQQRQSYVTEAHVAAAYAAIYMKVADTRKKIVRDIDKMSGFYLVEVIINQMTEDALAPAIGTGEIVDVSSDRGDIQREIDWLEEKFDFDQLALCLTPDLLKYGEYTLKTEVKTKPIATQKKDDAEAVITENIGVPDEEYGLQELHDTVDQGSVVAITRYNDIVGYLELDKKTSKMVRKDRTEYVKFSLTSQRIKIDFTKEFGADGMVPKEIEDLPRFVRVGKSAIYPVLAKLKELELLEALVPATKLSKLSSGSVIGVQVPAGYDLDQAVEAVRKVEGLLNKKVGVDNKLGEMTIENILTTAGRIKGVPIFGDKGTLSKLDYKTEEPDELLASVTDIRKVILTAVGVPYDLVFGGEEGDKGAILKKYARYLRRIKSIQKAIEEGLRQIVYIHLSNKGIDYKADDIKVAFHQKLIEVDQLDHLEFADTIVSMLDNVREFVVKIAAPDSPVAPLVDLNNLAKYLNDHLNIIGFTNLINMEKVESGKHQVRMPGVPDAGDPDQGVDDDPGLSDDEPSAPAVEDVATALNGAQVTSLVGLITQVGSGDLPEPSAIEIMTLAFPQISKEAAVRILAPLRNRPSKGPPPPEDGKDSNGRALTSPAA